MAFLAMNPECINHQHAGREIALRLQGGSEQDNYLNLLEYSSHRGVCRSERPPSSSRRRPLHWRWLKLSRHLETHLSSDDLMFIMAIYSGYE